MRGQAKPASLISGCMLQPRFPHCAALGAGTPERNTTDDVTTVLVPLSSALRPLIRRHGFSQIQLGSFS